ncbi:MAG TPA: 16S rRNA (cytidine(1402)-2'-O)-methyltransferase [Thermomicrobiales bacterium]|nr:16S rRNA (cytidine(1402)-2'-O)-methyltransferase [Thermomicrobiales bacterium]
MVAVPIGNLRDITYRAVDVLRGVDVIAAEDTRDFRELQREHGISTRVVSYHDYNEQTRARQLIERLRAGESVALVSDAGTPLVNDPGFRIVGAAIEAGVPVTSVPGASAVLTALTGSGLPLSQFVFLGFPPRGSGKRRAFFAGRAREQATLVFFEAPHRLAASLEDLREALGDRHICLARNLTKPHERYQRGTVSDILQQLAAEGEARGEATVVVAGCAAGVPEEVSASVTDEIDDLVRQGLETRAILERVTREHGLKRREAYELVLKAKDRNA